MKHGGEKMKLFVLLLVFVFLLNGCTGISMDNNNQQEENLQSNYAFEERQITFIEDFSQNYPNFELLDYILGSDENAPIQCVVIAENKETNSSSTLFIVDDNGVGQVVLASEYLAMYRKEDGLYLDKNVILVSLDVMMTDSTSEIHDFAITVTQEENEGTVNTVYSSEEVVRKG